MQIETIHLDDPYVIKSWKFSGGEVGVRLLEDFSDRKIKLFARLNSSDDVMKLLMVKDALEHQGCSHIEVYIPYLPYSRQDRVCSVGDSFSLFRFARMINESWFSKVYTFDVHSDVAAQYFNAFNPINNIRFATQAIEQLGDVDYIVAPDKGALPKIKKLSESIGNFPYMHADKKRDPATGKILGLEFPDGTPDLAGRNLLVCDDCLDAGGTFIGLAQEAKELGAARLYLAISHGIFSKGIDCIWEHYHSIFTTNSFRTEEQYQDLFGDDAPIVWDILSESF